MMPCKRLSLSCVSSRVRIVNTRMVTRGPAHFGCSLDGAHGKEHRRRRRPRVRLPLDQLDRDEAVIRVEIERVGLRVHDDADAAVVVGHFAGELEHEAKKPAAESLPSNRLVDRETGEPKHRQGVMWQFLARGDRQTVDFDVTGGDRRETQNASVIVGDVGDADVVPELVLASELVEKAIEIWVPGTESRAIVRLAQRPNLHRASGGEALWWTCRTASA